MVIRRIGVGSAAKITAVIYAAIGLCVGVVFALISTVGGGFLANAGAENNVPAWFGAMFGAGALIFLPICYGVLGAIGGALTALVYNLVAGTIGGLQLDVD
jgi:hypothetical protein